jgi:hypothetical protein
MRDRVTKQKPDKNNRGPNLLLALAVLSCGFQFFWFASKCFNLADVDSVSYAGIARHVRQGEFYASVNAFRSPLVSWLVAASSVVPTDYLHVGKLVSMGSFVLCLALLYVFTLRLWHSKLVASLAVLLLTLGRGFTVAAVAAVSPDFLFASLVLVYFILLLQCVRTGRLKDWFLLGTIHGIAFLAKAFALPWLALCTATAVLLSGGPWRTKAARLGLAASIPLIAAAGWAAVLHSKYGVYTTGSQFKTNLLQWTLRDFTQHRPRTYVLMRDTAREIDEYIVSDPTPPGSWVWAYHVSLEQIVPKLFLAEKSNLPKAGKELTVVATPGVLIAFGIIGVILTHKRRSYPVEWRLTTVIAASALSLLVAYSMLVFDGHYLFPLLPLILAVGARFLIAEGEFNHTNWRRTSIALTVLGICASLVYSSSPFRVLTRDFQVVSYKAGALLRSQAASARLVSIGSGPFPEHGVGWEAGYQAAYFGGDRLIATMDSLPNSTELETLQADLGKANPDAVIVWGRPEDSRYAAMMRSTPLQYLYNSNNRIVDPLVGEVGTIFFKSR